MCLFDHRPPLITWYVALMEYCRSSKLFSIIHASKITEIIHFIPQISLLQQTHGKGMLRRLNHSVRPGVRFYSKEPEKINRHTILYKQFGKPFVKVCALSIGTYYGLMGLHDLLEYDLKKE